MGRVTGRLVGMIYARDTKIRSTVDFYVKKFSGRHVEKLYIVVMCSVQTAIYTLYKCSLIVHIASHRIGARIRSGL